jgi:3-oxoadipate enol-lactonase
MDLRERLPSILAPTLVIAAADDPATPPEHLRLIADSVPGARLEIIDGAAHLANIEQPARVTSLLQEHLANANANANADTHADTGDESRDHR